MRTPEGNQIGAIISRHIGAAESITGPAICEELGWPISRQRLVRKIISDESPLWPVLVCAISGDGYFVAANYEEAETYHNWLLDLRKKAQLKLSTFQRLAANHGLHFPAPDAPKIPAALAPVAEELRLHFGGVWASMHDVEACLLFSDQDPESPSYRASFSVPNDCTEEQLREAVAIRRDRFLQVLAS